MPIQNLFISLLILSVSSCGTYSVLRPADNLRAGQVELSGGAAMNSLPETVFVGQANVGVTNWLELGAQYEMYSAAGWMRFGILNTDEHGFALALSGGGGAVSVWDKVDSEELHGFGRAVMGGVTIGRRIKILEPYVAYRIFYLPGLVTSVQAIKGGLRLTGWNKFFLGLEGGATIHYGAVTVGEGAIALGIKFGG